ncbi:unnamed protein product [Arctia plantaginis]|uniref:Uncharacterized protein n=1 Tax=Arctia plantaginis TaxID=874455 RepID=A0A8S1B447_ARCPL|nr:unnamed protein product [Arctia plantaginis]
MLEDSLKELSAKRSSIKGRVTKFKNSLDVLDTLENISAIELSKLAMKLSRFEALFIEFDEVQNQIEILSVDKLEAELAIRDSVETDFYHSIAFAKTLLEKAQPEEAWPVEPLCSVDLPELKAQPAFVGEAALACELIDLDKYSSLPVVQNTLARMLRFIHNSRHPTSKLTGPLSTDERHNAMTHLIKMSQPELSKSALLESFTPKNITSGFSKPGIWLFNRLAFGDVLKESSQEEYKENSQETERQEVVFVEPERSKNDEIIAESCKIDETQTDPLDDRSDFDTSANVIPPLNVSPLSKDSLLGFQINNNIICESLCSFEAIVRF